jgi:type IV pilus assembly protein PilC
MAQYFYIAKSQSGQEKSGSMEAKDEHQLASALRQSGDFLIFAEKEKEKSKKGLNVSIPFLNNISLKEKLFFTRNLKVMVSAGISLPRALRTLAEITKNKKFKETLLKVVEDISKGKMFSESLAKYPDIFPEIFCSLIKAGEEAGTMEEALANLTQQMERQNELRSKIIGAMMYPAVIIVAVMGIGTMMLVMVIPKLAETFKDMGVQMPITTRIVMALGDFVSKKWYLALIILILLIVIIRFALNTKGGKRFVDKVSLKFPIISPLVQKTNAAYTTRTISSLIGSGVPIVKALEVTSNVLGNSYFKDALTGSAEKVGKGGKLSEAFKDYGNLYPLVVVQMIEVGEETGETADILKKLADFFEEEVATATKNMSSIVEPILMLLIGAAVGFFAVSMLQPMYSVMGSIK